jgi:hypothetical protein
MVTVCPSVEGFGELAMDRHRDGAERPGRVAGGSQHRRPRRRPVGQELVRRAAAADKTGSGPGRLEGPGGGNAGPASDLPETSQPPIAINKIGPSNMPIRAGRRTLPSQWHTGVVGWRPR